MKTKIILIVFALILIAQYVNAESSLEANPPFVKYSVTAGQTLQQELTLLNHGNAGTLLVDSGNHEFIHIDHYEKSISESQTIGFTLGNELYLPGVYVSKIIVQTTDTLIEIPVLLEVESFSPAFDAVTEILPQYAQIKPGATFTADITLYNLHSLKPAHIVYSIYNLEGEVVLSEEDEFEISQQVKVTKSFALPSDLTNGTYVFSVSISDVDSLGTSSLFFTTVSEASYSPAEKKSFTIPLIAIAAFLIGGLIILNHYWNSKLESTARYWNEHTQHAQKKFVSDAHKEYMRLQYQKSLLKKAYEKGYLQKDSYSSSLKKINAAISLLKKRL